jgi:hypothetical protein
MVILINFGKKAILINKSINKNVIFSLFSRLQRHFLLESGSTPEKGAGSGKRSGPVHAPTTLATPKATPSQGGFKK